MPKKQKSDQNFLISASTSRSPGFLGTTVYNYNIKPLAGNSSGEKMGKIFEKIVGWTGQWGKRYNGLAVYPKPTAGGANMQNLLNFLISIMASVAGNYISKWLNRDKKDS